MTGYTIILVEDEPDIRDMLAFTLSRAGYNIIEAESAEEAKAKIENKLPSLMLLDWMLPGMSGVDFARKIRQDDGTANLPIIMLTARGEESDKLKSFSSGVDDYITKPFSPSELIARVEALLRRSGNPSDGIVESHGIRLDLKSHQLLIKDEVVRIGPTEFRLLELFVTNTGRAFDRSQLLDRVWGRNIYVEERTVDVHILRLRKILKTHGLHNLIQTVRGIGYRFASEYEKDS